MAPNTPMKSATFLWQVVAPIGFPMNSFCVNRPHGVAGGRAPCVPLEGVANLRRWQLLSVGKQTVLLTHNDPLLTSASSESRHRVLAES
jgi:hypothetical protein